MIPNFIKIDNQTYFADIQIGMNKVLIRYTYNISSEGEDLQQACNRMVALLQAKGFIPKPEVNRTIAQNALMWKWYDIISKDTGNTTEYLHERMKEKFLSKKMRGKLNGKVKYTNKKGSTKKLSVKQFTEYLDNVYLFFAENGYVLPTMDKLDMDSLINTYGNR